MTASETSLKPHRNSVTIKSIAKELGVSFSTVSKALNNNPVIKEETRQMVMDKAREMGYTPNSLARSLRSNKSLTISVILNDIENPVLTHIFKRTSDEMARYGYTTMIMDSYFSLQSERKNILGTLAQKPDFVILEPASTNLENLKLFSSMYNHLILLGPKFEDVSAHQISVDYGYGGYLAASNMLSHGHRDNIIITTPLSVPNSADFVQGIRRAYKEFCCPLEEDRILETSNSTVNGGFLVLNELWDHETRAFRKPFTGVITFDDNMAYGVYMAAQQFGLKVPDDISVSGFDNNPLTAFSSPSLTTVHLPREKIADSCLAIIRSVLLNDDTQTHVFYIEPYLVQRESVSNRFTAF